MMTTLSPDIRRMPEINIDRNWDKVDMEQCNNPPTTGCCLANFYSRVQTCSNAHSLVESFHKINKIQCLFLIVLFTTLCTAPLQNAVNIISVYQRGQHWSARLPPNRQHQYMDLPVFYKLINSVNLFQNVEQLPHSCGLLMLSTGQDHLNAT